MFTTPRHPKQARQTRASAGFTLIELIAVIVILSILSAVAIPTMSSSDGPRQSAAAVRLRRDLQFARQRAVARGVRTWVVFDPANDRYSLFIEDAANPGKADRQPLVDEGTGDPMVVVLGVGPTRGAGIDQASIGGGDEIGFDLRGRPIKYDESILETDGTITLVGGLSMTIRARTGHIQAGS